MPEALIIGGPNGAGKSTLAYEILKREPLPFLSADEIAANINPSDPAAARFQAGRVFLRRLEETIEGRRSFMTETTLSGLAFKATMQRLRATGYAINIAFVFLESPELCIARIRSRVARGGIS